MAKSDLNTIKNHEEIEKSFKKVMDITKGVDFDSDLFPRAEFLYNLAKDGYVNVKTGGAFEDMPLPDLMRELVKLLDEEFVYKVKSDELRVQRDKIQDLLGKL